MPHVCRPERVNMSDSVIIDALRLAGPVKDVARVTGRSPRTIERWRQGFGEPPASVLVTIIRHSREAAKRVLAAAGLTNERMDAEEARLLDELTALRAMRRGDANTAAPVGTFDRAPGAMAAEAVAAVALTVSRRLR